MRQISKILLLAIVFFVVRIFQSCCDCTEEVISFDFEEITIVNLDNSGEYTRKVLSDAMYSEAVAFEVSILGNNTFAGINCNNSGWGFKQAMATQCDCEIPFKSNQQISRITIITHEAISPDLPADSDVTGLFLGTVNDAHIPSIEDFEPIEDLYPRINHDVYYSYSGEPAITIRFFYTENIENEKARFSFVVELTDGRSLSATTELIQIIESN